MDALFAFARTVVLLTIASHFAIAQDLRVRIHQSGYRFGSAATSVADLNGDGLRDIVVGDEIAPTAYGTTGTIRVYSRTGAEIGDFTQAVIGGFAVDPTQRLGAALCDIGVDSSGIVHCAVGMPGYDGVGTDSGRIALGLLNPISVPSTYVVGLSAGEEFGAALATLGDLTGDGLAEILVGAPKANIGGANAGRVSLLNGATGVFLYSVNGVPGSLFGSAIAAGRDVDLDGTPDFLVGAPNDSTVGTNRGRAFVFSGINGALIATLNGNSNGDNFGRAVALMRDQTGDGRAEIVVSAPGDDVGMSNNGAVTVHHGWTGAILRTIVGEVATDGIGHALATGDADHDGFDDILIGSPVADRGMTNNGVAALYSGADGALLWRSFGRRAGGEFGHTVTFLGDYGGTGLDEFLVSEWKFDCTASVVSFAPPSLPTIRSVPPSSGVFAIGDIDGDGHNDLAFRENVASPTNEPNSIAIVSSATLAVIRRLQSPTFFLPSLLTYFGTCVCDVGDVDADGVDDLAVGEANSAGGPTFPASVFVFSGATGSVLMSIGLPNLAARWCRGIGDTDGNGLREVVVCGGDDAMLRCIEIPSGTPRWTTQIASSAVPASALDVIGDINGDGAVDLVVGSKFDLISLPNFITGSVKVVSGLNGSIVYSYSGSVNAKQLGRAVAGVRDQNGDGVPDFAINSTFGTQNTLVYSGSDGSVLFGMDGDQWPWAVNDFTGDGVADLVIVNESTLRYFEGGTGAAIGGAIATANTNSLVSSAPPHVVVDDVDGDAMPDLFVADFVNFGQRAAAGVFVRGAGVKGTQRLSLTWNAVAGVTPTDGAITVDGGAASSTALLMVAQRGATIAFEPYIAYLDVYDPSFGMFPIALDAAGHGAIAVDLRDPAIADLTFHLQAIDTSASPDGTYSISNGLVVRFMP